MSAIFFLFKEVKKSIQWGEETLTLETGKVARQADGTVIATYGETTVMANVTFAKKQNVAYQSATWSRCRVDSVVPLAGSRDDCSAFCSI